MDSDRINRWLSVGESVLDFYTPLIVYTATVRLM